MKWYFVRHGEIESNIKKVYAGWNDEGLTPTGVRQAVDAVRELSNYKIEVVCCSPLRRTVQTAEIIGDVLHKKPLLAESFKELKMGPWEGLSESKVAEDYPDAWDLWNSRPADLVLEGRETLSELQARALKGVAQIREEYYGKSILVVSHVAVIRVLLLYCRGMNLNFYKTVSVANGQVFEMAEELLQ